MALEQSAWELMAIGMGLLKDREMPIGSARLLSLSFDAWWPLTTVMEHAHQVKSIFPI